MRNGSGTYTLPVNSWNPATNAVSATASDWQSLIDDVETALTASLAADGQTPMTGNLAMGNNKLTGLAAGTAAGNSLRWEQLFSQGTEVDIASATTTDIGGQNSNFLQITGTTTITGFGTNYNGPRFLRFAGVLTLTHGSALVLPGAASITTAAGDMAIAIPKATTGTPDGWVVLYQRASALPALSGANTDITSLASPAIAAATATTQATTDISTKVATTAYAQAVSAKIQPITASVASSALTITLNPTVLDFRSNPLTSGTVVSRSVAAAISVVVSSGSTLGTVNAVPSRLAVLAIDNAGTVELAVVNLAGGNNLDESTLISTTAEGGAGAADSANVIYSTTARTNVAFRVVGYVESTQATAGTWATAPSTIQGAGGQAIAYASLGYGQTWQSVTRNNGTTYYNTTGRPIVLTVTAVSVTAANNFPIITVGGVAAGYGSAVAATNNSTATAIIPPGAAYSWTIAGGSTSNIAVELR